MNHSKAKPQKADGKNAVSANGNKIVLLTMIVNLITGFASHVILYPILQNYFTERASRLLSFTYGMVLDILLSWGVLKEYERTTNDRRKGPTIPLDRYLFVRAISAMTLGAGVLFGYLLDRE